MNTSDKRDAAQRRTGRIEPFLGSASTGAPRFTSFLWIQEPLNRGPTETGRLTPTAQRR